METNRLENSRVDSSRRELNPATRSIKPVAERMVLDTTIRVTTPEYTSFQYQIAGPFRRVIAYVLDVLLTSAGFGALLILGSLAVTFLLGPLAAQFGLSSLLTSIIEMLASLALIGWFITYWFYGAIMETYFNGQTLGKRWTAMRVLSTNGHSIDGVQATLRNFFRLLDLAPTVPLNVLLFSDQPMAAVPTCLFGLIMMTISPKYQRIGDLVAGTVVVSEVTNQQPELIAFTDERVPNLAELIPASYVVSPTMAKAIADFADQRRYLPLQRASEIASHLAKPLIEKFGLLPDTDHDLFICALYYKTFVNAQAENDEATGAPLALPASTGSPSLSTEATLAATDSSSTPQASLASVPSQSSNQGISE
jgi:uncharacterized RDD family membrane protein YckC